MPLARGQLLQRDLGSLREQVKTLRQDLQMQVASEAEHRQQTLGKLQQLSEALQEFNQSTRNSNTDFGGQMERMIHDVQELRGAVQRGEQRLGETTQSLAERLEKLAQKNPRRADAGGDVKLPADKKEALALAASQAKDGKVAASRATLRALLAQPKLAAGIADEAHFHLGESYLADKAWAEAQKEYVDIVEKFASSPRLDEATYKIGLCALMLGHLDDAKTFFGELCNNRRRSAWSKVAKAKLDEIGRREARKRAP